MRVTFLKGFGDRKPLIMYSNSNGDYLFSKEEVLKNIDINKVVAYELKKDFIFLPFRKYAPIDSNNALIDSNNDIKKAERVKTVGFLDLLMNRKKDKEIYSLKKLDDLASLCPDKVS